MTTRLPRWAAPLGYAVLLFVLNVYLCHELFGREFTERMESIESSYMAFARWVGNHGIGRAWFPVWYAGTPVRQVYQPGLPVVVSWFGHSFGWTTQHAYHFATALAYSLGPVVLCLFAWRVTGWAGYGFVSGLLYSVLSPISLLVPLIRWDTGSLITARRFIVLTRYGEGPHSSALLMVLPVVLIFHCAATERRRWALVVAPLALAAIPLTNWPGTMGLVLALLAYGIARLGARPGIHWPIAIGMGVIAYLIACPWIPPSTLALVQRNAHQSDGTQWNQARVLGGVALLGSLLLLHFLFERWDAPRWLRFFFNYAAITGVISVGWEWYRWSLLPQPNRFGLDFEMAVIPVGVWVAKWIYDRCEYRVRVAAVALLVVFCVYQGYRFRKWAPKQIRPIAIETTIEYRMAQWFDQHMKGARVFAPGNVSLWMNMFTDTPQMSGCCDQGIPVQEHRIADYVIYTGQNAGAQDAGVALLWMKAYGVDAVGVSGPKSTEAFHPFWNARKFEGVLPVLWRDGDNAIYDLGRRSRSLAHVIGPGVVVRKGPENGLDVAQLAAFVGAVEDPGAREASFQWRGIGHARIEADLRQGDVLAVQVTYDPGWRVTVNGQVRKAAGDGLGLVTIDPGCTGRCVVDMDWDGGSEARYTRMAAGVGGVLLLAWAAVIGLGFLGKEQERS